MTDGRYRRGFGALSIEQQQAVLALLRSGMSQAQVARYHGVSKNVIAGLWARQGDGAARKEPTTLYTRCAALHEALDAVLAQTLCVPRIPNEPRRH